MMEDAYLCIKTSTLYAVKRISMVRKMLFWLIMASLLLTRGKSVLKKVPASSDVLQMISLLCALGAHIVFDHDAQTMEVDTSL
jgi:UDP-N-acetylglucosamine enolpyruvyl transferase